MIKQSLRISLEAGFLIALLGVIVWATGRPFLFPSLGPSAFALALRNPADTSARQVIGGHLCGVVAGLLVYHSLAEGLIITTEQAAFSLNGLLLSASGALSVSLTAVSMLIARASHAPACATTLIISLGLLPTVLEGGIILGSVVLLFVVHRGFLRFQRETADQPGSADRLGR